MKKMFKYLTVITVLFIIWGCKNKNKFVIDLISNASTGYSWTYKINNDGLVLTDESQKESNTEIVGAPGIQSFEFTAKKEGTTIITLSYDRSWEEAEPVYQLIYKVTVGKNNKITDITSEGTYFEDEKRPQGKLK